MGEISNKSLALLVLAALVVVVVATSIQLNTLSGVTGFATQDSGTVNLTVGESLAIAVDTNYNFINFGTCSPNASGIYTVDSNDTYANTNCSGDTSSQRRIQINNVGNVDADVNVTGECTVGSWLPDSGNDNLFEVAFYDDVGTGCGGTLSNTYQSLGPSAQNACDNLTVGGNINMSARVTIDTDTTNDGSCAGDVDDQQNTITFNAYNVN